MTDDIEKKEEDREMTTKARIARTTRAGFVAVGVLVSVVILYLGVSWLS